jgi:hypothetical protein
MPMSEQAKAYLAARKKEKRSKNPNGRILTQDDFNVAWDCLVLDTGRQIGAQDEETIEKWLNSPMLLDECCMFGYCKYLRSDFMLAMYRRIPHRFLRIKSGPVFRVVAIFVQETLWEVLDLFGLAHQRNKNECFIYHHSLSANQVRCAWRASIGESRCRGETQEAWFLEHNPWADVKLER